MSKPSQSAPKPAATSKELDRLRIRVHQLESMLAPLAKRTAKAEWLLAKKRAELDNYRLRKGMRLLDATTDFIKRPTQPIAYSKRMAAALKAIPKPKIPTNPPPLKQAFAEAEIITKLEYQNLNSRLVYPQLRLGYIGSFPFPGVALGIDLAHTDWELELSKGLDAILITVAPSKTAQKILDAAKAQKIAIIDWPLIELPPGVDLRRYNPINWQRLPSPLVMVPGRSGIESDALLAEVSSLTVVRPGSANLLELAGRALCAICLPSQFTNEAAFTQQVLELMAIGVPVLTPPHPLLGKVVAKPYLLTVHNNSELKKLLKQLDDNDWRERWSVGCRRYAALEHSLQSRLESLMKTLNIDLPAAVVSILLCTSRPHNIIAALKQVAAQSHPHKELVLILHGDNFPLASIKTELKKLDFPTRLLQKPSSAIFGECLNAGLDAASGTFITKMDDDDIYGPNHLLDLLAAYRYTGADIVGKWSNFVHFAASNKTISWYVEQEERFGGHLPGATMLMRRDFLTRYRFGRVRRAVDSDLRDRVVADGGQLYSTHRYNFVRVRHDSNTYRSYTNKDYLALSSGKKRRGLDLKEVFV